MLLTPSHIIIAHRLSFVHKIIPGRPLAMTKVMQFLTPSDVMDICCPSTSRSTVADEGNIKIEVESYTYGDRTDEDPFIILHSQNKFDDDEGDAGLNEADSTRAVMAQLAKVREDLKKVPTLSSKDKSHIISMLLLLRGEVSNKKNKGGTSKKFLSKFRFDKSLLKKTADV